MKNSKEKYTVFSVTLFTALACFYCVRYVSFNNLVSVGQGQSPNWYLTNPTGWLTKSWSGKQTLKYKLSRQTIESEAKNNTNPSLFVDKYRQRAIVNNNPLSVFEWGTAVIESTISNRSTDEVNKEISDVRNVLASSKDPDIYEYSRLRFLIEAYAFPNPKLKYLGLRLLNKCPDDYSVKYQMIRLLESENGFPGSHQAIKYASDLIQLDPRHGKGYSALASVYSTMYMYSKKESDRILAIKGYEKYLELAPIDDNWRQQAQILLTDLKSQVAQPSK